MDTQETTSNEILKVAPPVGVSTLSIMGVQMNDIVYMLTILYLCVQIGCLLYKTFKTTKQGGKRK